MERTRWRHLCHLTSLAVAEGQLLYGCKCVGRCMGLSSARRGLFRLRVCDLIDLEKSVTDSLVDLVDLVDLPG